MLIRAVLLYRASPFSEGFLDYNLILVLHVEKGDKGDSSRDGLMDMKADIKYLRLPIIPSVIKLYALCYGAWHRFKNNNESENEPR